MVTPNTWQTFTMCAVMAREGQSVIVTSIILCFLIYQSCEEVMKNTLGAYILSELAESKYMKAILSNVVTLQAGKHK